MSFGLVLSFSDGAAWRLSPTDDRLMLLHVGVMPAETGTLLGSQPPRAGPLLYLRLGLEFRCSGIVWPSRDGVDQFPAWRKEVVEGLCRWRCVGIGDDAP